jgi:hypothetical protein
MSVVLVIHRPVGKVETLLHSLSVLRQSPDPADKNSYPAQPFPSKDRPLRTNCSSLTCSAVP